MLLPGVLSALACHDVGNPVLPAGVTDPNAYRTPEGAQQLYNNAVYTFASVSVRNGGGSSGSFVSYVVSSGLLTDELQAGNLNGTLSNYLSAPVSVTDSIDARLFPEHEKVYDALQNVRGVTSQALAALTMYAPATSPALRGHMFALDGYAELLLADLYCSGVPLSTVDFNANFTYHPGSATTDVYQHALALFDTAVTLSTDSVRILNLARIGQARVLLALGRYAEAAQAVASVPTAFQYVFYANWNQGVGAAPNGSSLFASPDLGENNSTAPGVTVANSEGMNGLPYIASGDPRSRTEMFRAGVARNYFQPQYAPMKYGATAPTVAPVVVASGVEARLIEAEASLHAGAPDWLTTLNALRTDGTVLSQYTRTCAPGITGSTTPGSPCPAGVIDTTWGSGTGIGLIPAAVQADVGPVCATSATPGTVCTDTIWYKGLHPLADPGLGLLPAGKSAMDVRVDLLFAERAYWLFLTGERQGDLRRLVRNYGRSSETVYPTGTYLPNGQLPSYGGDVSLNIPSAERNNPQFHGCLSQGA